MSALPYLHLGTLITASDAKRLTSDATRQAEPFRLQRVIQYHAH